MAKADAAREAGNLPHAIALYKQVVQKEPRNAQAWWYLGLSYYDRDEFPGCVEAFNRVSQLDLKNGPAHVFAGLCEFRVKKYEDALAHIVEGKRLGVPEKTELDRIAQYHYVLLLGKLGQFEAAASALVTLAKTTPDAPRLVEMAGINALRIPALPDELTDAQKEPVRLAGRAALAAWQQGISEARKLADELLAKYPDWPNVHYFSGWLRLREHSDAAIAEFEKELARDPSHVQAYLQIANEYLKRGESAKALSFADRAADLAPGDFAARTLYGRVLMDQEKFPEAIRELSAAVQLVPTNPEAHLYLAKAYERSGQTTEAAKHRKLFSELAKLRQDRNQ